MTIGGWALSGCGSASTTTTPPSSSTNSTNAGTAVTKPSYCSSLTSLKQSITALAKVKLTQSVSALTAAVSTVQGDAEAFASSAASDFLSLANGLKRSVDALSATASQVASSPSAAVQIPKEVSAVAAAVKGLQGAASAKCG